MPYKLKISEQEVLKNKDKYKNAAGHAECVEFIRQATNAPQTATWKKGLKVETAKPGEIPRGTAIATFDDNGKYPADALGKHAAIYLFRTKGFISVLDQWRDQGEVKPRQIMFGKKGMRRSNDGSTFFVIE